VHCVGDVDPESLRAFLADRLASFEIPRYIQISPQPLPRTPSGQIFKRRLRDEAVKALIDSGDGRSVADA
jgi:acyl-CoA synthetase (AMP-forming)/AMP-acid ligase II